MKQKYQAVFNGLLNKDFFNSLMNKKTPLQSLSHHSDLHLTRKLWHILMGCALFWFAFFSGLTQTIVLLSVGLLLLVDFTLEMARLKVPAVNETAVKVCGPIMRESEKAGLSGIPFFLSGTLLALFLFPRPVAQLCILYLIFADPAASVAGITLGHKGPRLANNKTLIGTAAGFLVCFVITAIHSGIMGVNGWKGFVLALVGGVAGSLAEALFGKIDDNLTIPVVSGSILWIVYALLF